MVVCFSEGCSASLAAVDHLSVVDSFSLTVANATNHTLQQADSTFAKISSQAPSDAFDAVLIDACDLLKCLKLACIGAGISRGPQSSIQLAGRYASLLMN